MADANRRNNENLVHQDLNGGIYNFNFVRRKRRNKQKYKCSICWRLFGNKTDLINHHRIHTKSGKYQPFKCKICKKGFAQQQQLKNHCNIHSGSLPFECKVCHKAFGNPGILHNHLRIHDKIKQFKCKTCNSSFHRKDHLKRHYKKHQKSKNMTRFNALFINESDIDENEKYQQIFKIFEKIESFPKESKSGLKFEDSLITTTIQTGYGKWNEIKSKLISCGGWNDESLQTIDLKQTMMQILDKWIVKIQNDYNHYYPKINKIIYFK